MTLPWSHTPPGPSAAQAILDRINAMVAVASGLAATGRAVDLTGLEAAAGRLCAQVLDLPPNEGLAFRPALIELDGRLANIQRAIEPAP